MYIGINWESVMSTKTHCTCVKEHIENITVQSATRNCTHFLPTLSGIPPKRIRKTGSLND